jgi:hypothetical protein
VPLQVLLGGTAWYKWWIFVVFLTNAAAFRLLAREEIADPWAAAVATVLYAINPYLLFEFESGRPTQALTAFLVAALILVRRVDRSRDAVFCGIAVAVTGWTYWFYAYFFAFICLWLVPAILWDHPNRRAFLRGLAIAAGIAILLVLPAVVPMILRDVKGNIPGIEHGHGWLELPKKNGPLVEGYQLWEPLGPRLFQSPAWAMILAGWALLGRGRRRWLGAAAVGLFVAFGLGTTVGGQRLWSLPYVLLYNKLPFFDRLWFPYRATSVVFVAVSLGAGFLLMRLAAATGRRWVVPAGGTALIAASLAASWADGFVPLDNEGARLPAAYTWMASKGGAILDLPRGTDPTYIVWQPQHRLPLFGGMGENVSVFWPPGHRRLIENRFVNALNRACRDPERPLPSFTAADRQIVRGLGFRWVVLHRELVDFEFDGLRAERGDAVVDAMPFAITRRLDEVLGDPIAQDGAMVVWSLDEVGVPPADLAPAHLWDRTWTTPQPAAYARTMSAQGRAR